MKIAIVIPPFTTLPAKGHGGTERIAEGMINELLRRGNEMTLIGAGKNQTKAKYVEIFSKTISEQNFEGAFIEQSRPLRIETAYIAKVMKYLVDHDGEYEVVFNHMRGGFLMFPLSRFLKTPIISTLHLPLFKEVIDVLSLFKNPNVITISNSQRKPAGNRVNFLATVYNGLDINEFPFNENPKDFFLYMGAMGEHKSPHLACEVARKTKVKLILAGGKIREPYFSKMVKPFIDNNNITFVGEVEGEKRLALLKNAKGFLMPITWEEPFGLVMIEAMACGTPVIAFNHGAVSEVVVEAKTGFVVQDIEEMAVAVGNIETIKRLDCRRLVEEKFTYKKMVDDYLAAFEKVKEEK